MSRKKSDQREYPHICQAQSKSTPMVRCQQRYKSAHRIF